MFAIMVPGSLQVMRKATGHIGERAWVITADRRRDQPLARLALGAFHQPAGLWCRVGQRRAHMAGLDGSMPAGLVELLQRGFETGFAHAFLATAMTAAVACAVVYGCMCDSKA